MVCLALRAVEMASQHLASTDREVEESVWISVKQPQEPSCKSCRNTKRSCATKNLVGVNNFLWIKIQNYKPNFNGSN